MEVAAAEEVVGGGGDGPPAQPHIGGSRSSTLL